MTLNVLVTGAGGVYGEATVANLRRAALDVRVVAADLSWHAPGSLRAHRPVVLPRCDAPDYAEALAALIREESVRAVFVCSGTEIAQLASRRAELEAATGALFVLPAVETLAISADKLATARWLAENGFAAPLTFAAAEYAGGLPFPILAKPRFGMGSRGILICRSDEELARAPTAEEYVFQEYLGDLDHEFTVGVVATEDGEVLAVTVLRRWLSAGQTGACEVVDAPRISDYAEAIATRLRPRGYLNVQLRLRGEEPVCFEINARVSSSTGFRALAGVNEPELILRKYVLGETPARPVPSRVAMVRGLEERIVDPDTWRLARARS